jgi:protocatechuate 3,4-dioxygenase beta subunit
MSKHEHKHGLSHDLPLITARNVSRRRLLGWGLGAGVVTLIACPQDGRLTGTGGTAAGSGGSNAGTSSGGSCTRIPEETGGPYPADGSNGVNALTLSGIVRSDIRSSFGGANGVAAGVPLTVTLNLVDAADGCSPAAGCAVYLWHCDRDGNYSLYSSAIQSQSYLRGVQESDDAGQITFQTIFPGCYSGRWPHIHFEVFESLQAATSTTKKLATSQLALPEDSCKLAYAVSGYESSVRNLQQSSLASDNVFSDGWTAQTPSVSGDISGGFRATLTVAVAVAVAV